MGVLVVLALVLVTLSFRETNGGPVTSAQNAGAAALRPFEIAATRVARPFHDAYSWFHGLLHARSDQKKLRAENERLRQLALQNEFDANQTKQLKALLDFKEGPTFPADFNSISASVISRPTGAFAQAIVVSAGSADGVELLAPVVTGDGLIGLVTRVTTHASRVTLLTDEQSAVSALDAKTDAAGVVGQGPGFGVTLELGFVSKDKDVRRGDTIVTAGWRSAKLASLYPKGIPIGTVTSVGQGDTDLYKQIQVQPFADFSALDAVIVLVRKTATGAAR